MIRNGNICFSAYKPGCPGDLWQGIYVRFKRDAEPPPGGGGCRVRTHMHIMTPHKVVFCLSILYPSGWMSYRIPLCRGTRDNSHTGHESILKTGWQIIIFAPLNCPTGSRGERAVKGNLERVVLNLAWRLWVHYRLSQFTIFQSQFHYASRAWSDGSLF